MSTCDSAVEGPSTRMWNQGWRRYVFPGFWLVYLAQTINGIVVHNHGATAAAGILLVVAFSGVYLAALPAGWGGRDRTFWGFYAAAVVLTVAVAYFARADAFVLLVYVSVLTIASQRRWAVPVVIGFAAAGTFVPPLVPSWHAPVEWDAAVTILLVSLAMFGFFKIIQSNIALTSARAEVARLAAENERTRIARDLHDLLGHSLTTITVKAGLARKLAERGEDDRARTEITEVEQLSRRTLGDVRAAVSAHREVTLAGEIATAREVLRAAGITAELPSSVAEVHPDVDALFGWAVREGVTNVVRHSRAAHATIEIGPRSLAICDDGGGAAVGSPRGNGLRGLQERVAAAAGTLRIHTGVDGFTVRITVPEPKPAPRAAAPASTPSESAQPSTAPLPGP